MPTDSIGYQDAWLLPQDTPGLYLVTRGQGSHRITVVLREDTHTLHLEMVQILHRFFDAMATDTVIKRYACAEG